MNRGEEKMSGRVHPCADDVALDDNGKGFNPAVINDKNDGIVSQTLSVGGEFYEVIRRKQSEQNAPEWNRRRRSALVEPEAFIVRNATWCNEGHLMKNTLHIKRWLYLLKFTLSIPVFEQVMGSFWLDLLPRFFVFSCGFTFLFASGGEYIREDGSVALSLIGIRAFVLGVGLSYLYLLWPSAQLFWNRNNPRRKSQPSLNFMSKLIACSVIDPIDLATVESLVGKATKAHLLLFCTLAPLFVWLAFPTNSIGSSHMMYIIFPRLENSSGFRAFYLVYAPWWTGVWTQLPFHFFVPLTAFHSRVDTLLDDISNLNMLAKSVTQQQRRNVVCKDKFSANQSLDVDDCRSIERVGDALKSLAEKHKRLLEDLDIANNLLAPLWVIGVATGLIYASCASFELIFTNPETAYNVDTDKYYFLSLASLVPQIFMSMICATPACTLNLKIKTLQTEVSAMVEDPSHLGSINSATLILLKQRVHNDPRGCSMWYRGPLITWRLITQFWGYMATVIALLRELNSK